MAKFYRFTLLFCAVCITLQVSAQLSIGGKPVSFLYPSIAERTVPVVQMPDVDVPALLKEDEENMNGIEKPYRFGFEMAVQINPENAGVTDLLPGGDKLWRVAITSPGAKSINFIFSKYLLPEGAQLFIYNADKSEIIGAFTAANNQEDEQLGTTLVFGDMVIVEYYEPQNPAFHGQVEIGTVVHGYRSLAEPNATDERGFGASGSCNINVNCPLGTGWESQRNSVAKIVNGGDWCTGALIGNTGGSPTPYFLTANHCYANSIGTWVFWFNYQSSSCSNGSNPPYNSISGSTLKARRANSDFCLLQLSSAPPGSFSPYYAGWDRSGAVPTNSTGIHHPSGDIKKISRDDNPATNGSAGGWGADHWRVYWDQGVTEGGSSGSPLFDQNQRIVGQLHGGASACGNSPANLWDEYGKVSDSWNGSSANKRLRDWLNPANNVTTMDGYVPATLAIEPTGGSNVNVASSEGIELFDILSSAGGWRAESLSPWVKVNRADDGFGELEVSYAENSASATRKGIVRLTSPSGAQSDVTVTQFGKGSKADQPTLRLATLFPNPTAGLTTVKLLSKGTANVTVFDMTGRAVMQLQGEGQFNLDLSGQANGIYYVRIQLNGEVSTVRLAVQR